ncbi:MAG: SDR family NAD(P)-dependent oxidoreductase [Chloroflexota bacterium]
MLSGFSLQGKVAVIAGGERRLELEMMEAGASVVAVDRLGNQALEAPTQAGAWALDITDAPEISDTFVEIARDFGVIDILVAAAGIVDNIAAEEYPAETWRTIVDVNISGSIVYLASLASSYITRHVPVAAGGYTA